jgi:RND family efflux transporter MFP subunit
MTTIETRRLLRPAWLRLAAVLAAALLAGCGGDGTAPAAGAPAPPAMAIDTAVAAYEAVPEIAEASGGVEPWRRVSPGSKILGRVDEVAVQEGDRVAAGQLLARLERRDLAAAVEQAAAAVAMAEAQAENARRQRERMETLHARGSVTDKNLEDATAGDRVAAAAVAQARANLDAARVAISYSEVRSPLAGWVVERRVQAGDMATPGQPLFTIEDLSRVKVVVEVAEAEVVGLAPGAPATVGIDVLGSELPARVDRVVPAGDPASRTFAVKLVLDNPDGRIKSGMFARARFPRGSRQALLVPRAAVVDRGQLRGLFVVDDGGRARLRWIKLGRPLGERVEVLAGLEPGERFAVAPPPGLSDGVPVAAAGPGGAGR